MGCASRNVSRAWYQGPISAMVPPGQKPGTHALLRQLRYTQAFEQEASEENTSASEIAGFPG